MKRPLVLGLIVVLGFLFGCEPPKESKLKDESSSETNATSQSPHSNDKEAEQIVKKTVEDFLSALRHGDEATATSMLTKTAQEKTTEHNMKIQPPGSSTAEFTVSEVEVYTETDEAQVLSSWSDNDSREIRQTYDIVWLLRKESERWGILGMATKVFDDQRPIILNFEDPHELMREKQWAEEEIARRNGDQPEGNMASKSEDTATR